MNLLNFKFDFVISYASENIEYAHTLKSFLEKANAKVFFSVNPQVEAELLGMTLSEYLEDIYTKKGRFCIVIISKDYVRKKWTKFEWNCVLKRVSDAPSTLYLLPVRLDASKLPSLADDLVFFDTDGHSVEYFADQCLSKLFFENKDSYIALRAAGLETAYATLPSSDIVELIAKATKRVRILHNWFPDPLQFEEPFRNAVRNEIPVNLLVLDPACPFTGQRSIDLGFGDEITGRNRAEGYLKQIERMAKEFGSVKYFQIKTFCQLPSMHIYNIDDVYFLGFYWHLLSSKLGPCLKVNGVDSFLGSRADKEFSVLWDAAEIKTFDTK